MWYSSCTLLLLIKLNVILYWIELYNSEKGTPLPHVKLGYQHVDDFLRSIPDIVTIYTDWANGLLYVKAAQLGNGCGSLFNVSFPENL
jgi:hypothetical protein